jgi:hypothetical protein
LVFLDAEAVVRMGLFRRFRSPDHPKKKKLNIGGHYLASFGQFRDADRHDGFGW